MTKPNLDEVTKWGTLQRKLSITFLITLCLLVVVLAGLLIIYITSSNDNILIQSEDTPIKIKVVPEIDNASKILKETKEIYDNNDNRKIVEKVISYEEKKPSKDISNIPSKPYTGIVCYDSDLDYKNFEEKLSHPYFEEIIDLNGEEIQIIVTYKENTATQESGVEIGLFLIKKGIPLLSKYTTEEDKYPCNTLLVEAWENRVAGSPGYIIIGGDGGITEPWLVYHELTHSFWNTRNSPVWFAEGSANILGTLLTTEVYSSVNVEEWRRYIGDKVYGGLTQQGYDSLIEGIQKRDIDPYQKVSTLGNNYLTDAEVGRLFLFDVYLIIGKENMGKMYESLYTKYLNSGEKLTNEDIKENILENTPGDKTDEIENLLTERW